MLATISVKSSDISLGRVAESSFFTATTYSVVEVDVTT
jgi:hypothetical protein